MKKVMSLAAISALLYMSVVYAHLCNNVYKSPDRLIVKPEKSVTSVDKTEEVRVFVKNNFPMTINDVVLSAKSDDEAVTAEVEPESVATMKPGEKVDFKLKIKVAEGAPAKKHKLSIGIATKQIGFESLDESPVPKLREIVENPKSNPSTKVLAAEALAKRKDKLGFQTLQDMATKMDSDYRSRAIRALGRVGQKSTLPFLREMLKEKDGYLKGNAVIALALAKSQSVTGLTDRDKFVRTCAQAGSAYRGNKKYVNELKAALEDTDEYVQVAAAWGLASLGEKEGIDLLDKTLATGLREQDRERAKELTRLRIFAGDSLISLPERDVESKAE